MSSDSSVRSVERAIDVLFSFTQQEPVLDIPALQQRTGLSRPTLYRLLRTLESRGLIYSLRIGISNGLVCEKPGKPDSALGGQPMPAWMAWNWRLGRCLVWIRPALTARLALVGP